MSDGGKAIVTGDAASALDHLRAVKPQPYEPDRAATAAAVQRFIKATPDTAVVWLADGLEAGGSRAFAQSLEADGVPTVLIADDRPGAGPWPIPATTAAASPCG